VISQVFLVILIQCLVEMIGTIAFPDFEEKSGKCQLNTCWIFMTLFIGFRSYMRMFRLNFSGIHYKKFLLTGVDLFLLPVSTHWQFFMLLFMCFVKENFQMTFSIPSVVVNLIY
jgi:hypothetical protein